MKKLFALFTAALLLLTPVAALADGNSRIVFGGDLTEKQRTAMLKEFNVKEDAVETLTVTIDEEKAYLGNLVPADKIGSRSLSSIYIQSASEGNGIDVTTNNITWVTSDMYISALTTAGIKDATIHVSSPVKVSGTAALFPYMSDAWREMSEVRNITDLPSINYPDNTPLTVRPDWRPAKGRPATTAEIIGTQCLDVFGSDIGILNPLFGIQTLYADDLAQAYMSALNDWITNRGSLGSARRRSRSRSAHATSAFAIRSSSVGTISGWSSGAFTSM